MRLMEKLKDLKAYRRVIAAVLVLAMAFGCSIAIYAFQTEEFTNRALELKNMGYSGNVLLDQMAEEFNGVDGLHGTGGIDGRLLDGSIAPNGILAGSESGSYSGSSTTQKPAHTHDYKETGRVESTCTSEGKITYTCDCGKEKTETLPLLDHDWQQFAEFEGSCIEKARVDLICMNCKATTSVQYSYRGHKYEPSSESTLPTCTEDGTQIKICSVCQKVWVYTLPAKGHAWDDKYTVDQEATCTKEGSRSIHCFDCDATTGVLTINAKGHKEAEYPIADPTFWEDGLITIRCEECYTHFKDITIPAKGGNWRYVIIASAIVILFGGISVSILKKKKKE